jgi:hypothetical protein
MKLNAARESLTVGIFLNGFPHRVRPENLIYLILRRRGLGGYQGLGRTIPANGQLLKPPVSKILREESAFSGLRSGIETPRFKRNVTSLHLTPNKPVNFAVS